MVFSILFSAAVIFKKNNRNLEISKKISANIAYKVIGHVITTEVFPALEDVR